MVCPLYRGCPLLSSNRIILIGRDKFGDLVLSIVERYLIQCPFLGGSSLRGSTVSAMAAVGILWIFMIMVRFYFPACTLNWVQTRTRAPMGVCQTLSPSSKNGKGSATPDYSTVKYQTLSESLARARLVYVDVSWTIVTLMLRYPGLQIL